MNELTQSGIAALKSGDRASARQFLTTAVKQDPNNALAWLWLTGALDSDDERLACLRQVLRIDPGNQAAAHGMTQILQRRTRATAAQPGSLQAQPASPATKPSEPEPVLVPTAQPQAEIKPVEIEAPISSPDTPPALVSPPAAVDEPALTDAIPASIASTAGATTGAPAELPVAIVTPLVEAVPAPQPVGRRVSRPPADNESRSIFRTRPSLVPALLCFWLFLIGSAMVASLLNNVPEIGLPLAGGLALILELVVIYAIISTMAIRYELTSQQLTLPFDGKRAHIPIANIYNVQFSQSFWQRLIGIGHIDIDATVNGQLAHVRLKNIPHARMRVDQMMYLVRDHAPS